MFTDSVIVQVTIQNIVVNKLLFFNCLEMHCLGMFTKMHTLSGRII